MSKIEWTQKTWNPVTGCNKVSQGCKNCYAEVMHKRLQKMQPQKYGKDFLSGVQMHEDVLPKPYRWKPSLIFVNSMSDLFHEDVPFEFIKKVLGVIYENKRHTFQILTKRAERMRAFFEWLNNSNVQVNFPNMWVGVSVEDQKTSNERIPHLVASRAGHKFLSIEPLLGPIDLSQTIYQTQLGKMVGLGFLRDEIGWVIVGGESGHKARPMNPDWVTLIKFQCENLNIPFFFKQWGEWLPGFLIPDGLPTDSWAKMPRTTLHQNAVNQIDFLKLGKKQSGRLFYGKEYDGMPKEFEKYLIK